MKLSQTYHLNDKTLKYMSFAQSKRQHQYLNLPGEYDVRLPQEMVFTDMTSARGDEIYYNIKLPRLVEAVDFLEITLKSPLV
ncbi:hypothetical protein [uncultured Methanobrevibacter sp.]|uniref:hypothetical protein n=1 Tax=uncultured Methanobrevibacter sp. TaxID=253161 RepID=UPI0025E9D07D|nr:hypothetical protein [uncultured Methanobrevibacter sp.]